MMQILSRKAPTWLRTLRLDCPNVPRAWRPWSRMLPDLGAADARADDVPRGIVAEKPMVIVVEDLHWTDVSTVDVLVHLAARLSRLRLLIIITYRDHELGLREHPFMRVRGELIARGQLEEARGEPPHGDRGAGVRAVGIRRQ